MTTFEELENELRIGLTLIAQETLNEDLTWIRYWDKSQFEKENFKDKILQIKKKKGCSIAKAVDYFIANEYLQSYEDDDFNIYTNLLYEIADQYINELERTEQGLVHENLQKELEIPIRDYFVILLDEITVYNWNDKELERLIKNLK